MESLAWVILGTTIFLFTLIKLLKHPHDHSRKIVLPPGPRPWPLIGNFNLIGPLPHQSLHKLAQTYGELMYLKFGSTPVVVASSPEMAKQFLKTHDRIFASRPSTAAGKYTTYNYQNITWAPYGSYWIQGRKIYLNELFSSNRLGSYEYIRVQELQNFVSRLHLMSGESIVLKDHLSHMNLSIVSRIVLGRKYFSESKEEKEIVTLEEFQEMLDELFLLNGVLNVGDWIPWLRFLDLQGYVKRMKALCKRFDRFHDHVFEEHRARMKAEGEGFVVKDMVDLLLKLADDPNLKVKLDSDGVKGFTQPTKNSLSWVPNKWRRLSLKNPASSSSVPKTTVNDVTKDVMDEAAKVPVEDGQDKNESHTLSRDAMEFYNNGDAPYCYSRILGLNKLHTDFWGVLLGYLNDGRLNAIHIEGWVRRMMFLRGAKKRTNPSIEFDWTILPPQFHSEMYDYRTKYGSEYANGMNELYPPFWEVQYIYIPIYVQAIEDWLLVQINLCTMELTQYWCNQKYSKHYGRLIHNGVLQKFDMFFDKLLDAVCYWRRVIHGPYKPQEKGYLKTGLINDDYLPKIGGALGKDSGVFLCMLMYKLVHKKAFTMEGGIEEHCMKFRHVMADQFYKTRFFPDE